MQIGRTYAYSLKATWRGRTLTRRIQIQLAKLTAVDLCVAREIRQPAWPAAVLLAHLSYRHQLSGRP